MNGSGVNGASSLGIAMPAGDGDGTRPDPHSVGHLEQTGPLVRFHKVKKISRDLCAIE